MKCECCGGEIEGNYVEYGGKYFDRHDNDNCIKNWLYDCVTDDCRYGTVINGEKIDLTRTRVKDKTLIQIKYKTLSKLRDICEKYELCTEDVLNDLVDDFLDELIKEYDIKPVEDEPKEIAPSWTEEYLATLGMSKRDFF